MSSDDHESEGSPPGMAAIDYELQWSDPDRVRAHLAAVVESSEDAIVSKTLDGIVTSWNRAAEGLFGFRASEMLGHQLAPSDRASPSAGSARP
jgi:PAS domain-containing protein